MNEVVGRVEGDIHIGAMNETGLIVVDERIRPYLDDIAERMWSGHAAVMIGAGFSKNAKPNGTSCPGFPDWPQLGDFFYEKIDGRVPGNKKYLNVLKLADEVQAALGRPALDQLLRATIPDKDYEPSRLHVKLLDLPWTDVFTTNYDTLLERACISVTSQKYDIVVNKEDLVYSERPRIIKLHGSFPSERPFIITEEDYRRYPKDFAPFVNTVQQALLENALCLIGFSGDDPNFLQWIGWIRDNLGKLNSPKIYLVGIFYFTEAQKILFGQKNIVIVDLTDCPGVVDDHYKALDLFIDYLLSKKKKTTLLEWPDKSNLLHPDSKNPDKRAQITELLTAWEAERLSYPGWCILPEDRRRHLWSYTQSWIGFIVSKDTLAAPMDIKFAYELNWRIGKCLLPLFNDHAALIEEILHEYLPFLDIDSINLLPATAKIPELHGMTLEDIRQMWLHLSLSMLCFYREEGFIDKWHTVNETLNRFIQYLSQEQKSFLYYERALFSLFSLDLPEMRKQLMDWPSSESLPYWEAKRAGLLAEIGQIEEAARILEQSLQTIRSKLNLKPVTTDYALVSQEAFIMLLLRYVKNAVELKKGNWPRVEELGKQFRERWNALKQYKCDPWNELELFERCLERPPIEKKAITAKKEFDIGCVTQTRHLAGSDEEATLAFTFLRFCEEAGIPFRIPGMNLGKKSAEGTLSRTSKYSPYWALVTLIRIGDDKVVDYMFNRESIARMDVAFIDNLIHGYMKAVERSQDDIRSGDSFHNDNFGILLARVIPEILSRLCCKCSDQAKYELIDFLLDIYNSDQRVKYLGIRHLTERLIYSFSCHQRFALIPILMKFPILEDLHPIVESEFLNPFHFLQIDKELIDNWSVPNIDDNAIITLLNKANSENPKIRKWSTFTLVRLYELNLLKKAWTAKLGKALWSQIDQYGLPDHTAYYKFAFLGLPHPKNIDPISLFRQFIHDSSFPIQKNNAEKGIPITGGYVPLCNEIVGAGQYIQWTEDEVKNMLLRLVEWWDADKAYLKRDEQRSAFSSIIDEFKSRFSKLVNILVQVIAQNLSQEKESSVRDTIRRLLDEFKDYGITSLQAETAFIHIYPDTATDIIDKIGDALVSSNSEVVVDGLKAILVITRRPELPVNDTDMLNLLSSLGQLVRLRRKTGLPSALNATAALIRERSSLFDRDFEILILKGLKDVAEDTNLMIGSDDLDISSKLEIRQEAAGLAYSLFEHYLKQGKDIPDVIRTWEGICNSEIEFAEIRNQWLIHDHNSTKDHGV